MQDKYCYFLMTKKYDIASTSISLINWKSIKQTNRGSFILATVFAYLKCFTLGHTLTCWWCGVYDLLLTHISSQCRGAVQLRVPSLTKMGELNTGRRWIECNSLFPVCNWKLTSIIPHPSTVYVIITSHVSIQAYPKVIWTARKQ